MTDNGKSLPNFALDNLPKLSGEELEGQTNKIPPKDSDISSQQISPSPLPPATVNGYRVWVGLGAIALTVVGAGIFFNRPQSETKQLPVTTSPSPPHRGEGDSDLEATEPVTAPYQALDVQLEARNEALLKALVEAEKCNGKPGDIDYATRNHVLEDAKLQLSFGIPIDVTLLRKIKQFENYINKELLSAGAFSGSPEHRKVMRSLCGDAWAILESLRLYWMIPDNDTQNEARVRAGEIITPEEVSALEMAGIALITNQPRSTNPDSVMPVAIAPGELSKRLANLWALAAVVYRRSPEVQIQIEQINERIEQTKQVRQGGVRRVSPEENRSDLPQ